MKSALIKIAFVILPGFAGVSAMAQEISPMSTGDVMVMYQQAVDTLKKQLSEANYMEPALREKMALQISEQSEGMLAKIAEVDRVAKIMGGNVFVAGVVVTYAGELNIKTPWSIFSATPVAEAGLAVFLKKNEEHISDSFRGTTVAILGAGGQVSPTTGVERRAGWEKNLRVKILFATGAGASESAVKLTDFQGAYVGLGGDLNAFGKEWGAQVYAKADSCARANPLNCSFYIVSFQRDQVEPQKPAANIQGMYLELPNNNNGEGIGF